MKEEIILIGGGGHCRSVIDVIESVMKYTIAGIIDQPDMVGKEVLGYKVIGTDADLDTLLKTYKNFHITVGHIKSNKVRVRIFEEVRSKGGNFPVIVSPFAYVSKHAVVEEGSVIMHKALVNAGAKVGTNCIINTGSVIEHDATVEDHCHVSTGAFVNGECVIGANSFIGSNATLVQCVTIGQNNIVAAGAVVTANTEASCVYAGNPATVKKKII